MQNVFGVLSMALNSFLFIMFLAVVVVVYYVLPPRFRNSFLLLASYVFYIWTAWYYAVLLLCSTLLSFFLTRAMDKQDESKRRKLLLLVSIVVPLLVLCLFKYYNFATAPISVALGLVAKPSEAFRLLLPIGISFYTFQVIGYNVDVYNRKVAYERNFIRYALFVSFFPTITAGPISRANELLPQFQETHSWNYAETVEGLQRFLTGAFKKVVVADGLSVIVDAVYNHITAYKGGMLVIAAILFSVQLYCDFSGYTDMAVGVARMLGFRVRENFSAPYLATNFSGFWQRWHMSLTSWLTDYVFIPLVWSRWWNKIFFGKQWDEHKPHVLANLLIVFLISGLWHGSTINFLIWGLLHGLLRVGEELINRGKKKEKRSDNRFMRTLKRCGVFLGATVTLVFFRANSLSDAIYFFGNLWAKGSWTSIGKQLLAAADPSGFTNSDFLFIRQFYNITFFAWLAIGLIAVICIDISIDRSMRKKRLNFNPVGTLSKRKRWAVYWLFAIGTAVFYLLVQTLLGGAGQFIYKGF